MGFFFAPGILVLNVVKLVILMYFRSWICIVCNVPSERIFRAGSQNFYYVLLLCVLFVTTMALGYMVVIQKPSFHCGPFAKHETMNDVVVNRLQRFVLDDDPQPDDMNSKMYQYVKSSGFIVPVLVLLMLIIW